MVWAQARRRFARAHRLHDAARRSRACHSDPPLRTNIQRDPRYLALSNVVSNLTEAIEDMGMDRS